MHDATLDQRIRDSFDRQQLMRTLGAELVHVADGDVRIRLPASPHLSQQDGFVHAGALSTIADSACGYACLTRMNDDDAVLSIEFKVNFLSPASGAAFEATGRVIRVGRAIAVASAEVVALRDEASPKCVAVMQATMMRVEGGAASPRRA